MTLSGTQIAELATAGGAAPSAANLQPWRLAADGSGLDLWLDAQRSNSFLDWNRLASVFALGSFAENVVLRAGALGLDAQVQISPHSTGIEARIARIAVHPGTAPPPADPLAAQIFARATSRAPGDGRTIPEASVARLCAGLPRDLKLVAVSDKESKGRFAAVLAEAEAIRMCSERMRREMFEEVRWSQAEAQRMRDRLDFATLGLSPPVSILLRLIRAFPRSIALVPRCAIERSFRRQAEASSHLCCIALQAKPDPRSMFDAGRSVQRLWLLATELGLSLHPMTILPYLLLRNAAGGDGLSAGERARLTDLGGRLRTVVRLDDGESPIFLFRLFTAPPPQPRALRRPWTEFTKT